MKKYRILTLFPAFILIQFYTFNIYAEELRSSAPWVGHNLKGAPCVGNGQGYGPYDYTNPNHRGKNLRLVEGAHFNQRVEPMARRHRKNRYG